MNILFITNAGGIDYESDMVFHGLVTSGHNVTDSRYMWYMSNTITPEQKYQLYGNGFTISGNLPDRKQINRDNIEERIVNHEFDLIVYGSIQRCDDYIDIVKQEYSKNRVVFIDGEDNLDIYTNLIDYGIMFKREQYSNICLPISFAIPEEKLCQTTMIKSRELARVKPQLAGHKNLYMFTKEEDYYKEYQDSMFGITKKKGGWDCLRHYEIIANKCLPFFEDFENKPITIMTNWSKELQNISNNMYISKNYNNYNEICENFFDYCKENLTTKKLAQYILGKTL